MFLALFRHVMRHYEIQLFFIQLVIFFEWWAFFTLYLLSEFSFELWVMILMLFLSCSCVVLGVCFFPQFFFGWEMLKITSLFYWANIIVFISPLILFLNKDLSKNWWALTRQPSKIEVWFLELLFIGLNIILPSCNAWVKWAWVCTSRCRCPLDLGLTPRTTNLCR